VQTRDVQQSLTSVVAAAADECRVVAEVVTVGLACSANSLAVQGMASAAARPMSSSMVTVLRRIGPAKLAESLARQIAPSQDRPARSADLVEWGYGERFAADHQVA
jgi:hypothetical protein